MTKTAVVRYALTMTFTPPDMPADLYNRLTALLLTQGGREGLFLANELKDLYGASARRAQEEPEIKPGILRADNDKPEGIGHTLHITTGQDPELLKDDYWNWVRKMGL